MTDQDGYGLIMPFVLVTSVGGPYDDKSFVAGYALGQLDTKLSVLKGLGVLPDEEYLEEALLPQVELIAMKHGLATDINPIEGTDDFVSVSFMYGDTDGFE